MTTALLVMTALFMTTVITLGMVLARDPVGTAFTYQGRLMEGGLPANGEYDLRFNLYDNVAGDAQGLLPPVAVDNLLVVDGLFTVELDFGDSFDGTERWLAIEVRPGDSVGAYERLSPRQRLSAVPYATFASEGPFWALKGNSGTLADVDFLGTTDGQPLIIKTNGTERMQISPTGNVGIGETDPTELLHINGTGIENDGTTGVVRIISGNGAQSMLLDGNEIDALADGLFLNHNSAENIVMATGGGSVGVGTANPASKFGVNGGMQASTVGTGGIGILGRSDDRAIVGVVGIGSCAGPNSVNIYGVGGCSPSNVGVLGASDTGDGVHARTISGNIFVGQSPNGNNRARIDSSGRGFFNGGTQSGGADFAESLPTSDDPATLEPGDVLVIDPRNPLVVGKSQIASSRLVAGVYSTRPALLAIGDHHIDDSREREVPVAIVGIVPTKVTTENGPIEVGDLLVTSDTPGHAMKARALILDGIEIYPTGAILGKALESLEEGTGAIRVLVTLK
jgi:hypothetical protein